MKKRIWAKALILLLVVGGITVGLYLYWSVIGQGLDPLAGWGRGNWTLSERTYYSSRMNRVIRKWAQTARHAGLERDGRFKQSYKTLLVIDLDGQAVWVEESGVVRENDYVEFPPGLKWQFECVTSQGSKELSGRIALKMRGAHARRKVPEIFQLVGSGRGAGHFSFHFHADGGEGVYSSGQFRPKPFRLGYWNNSGDSYGSILVSDSEYGHGGADGEIPNAQAGNWVEENEARWLRVEKSLYGQIKRQVRNSGYELRSIKVEPGPDFSAGHAEIQGFNDGVLRRLFRRPSSIDTYFQLEHLGDDIWYARNLPRHPERPMMTRQTLNLEFLIHPTSRISGSKRRSLLAKRKKMRQSVRTDSSKWKAILPSGATIEFIGVCENPSADKQWWGPDGSFVAYVPYVNTEPYARPRADRKIYELVWRIENPARSGALEHYLDGCTGSYYRPIRNRYGSRIIESLNLRGQAFSLDRTVTLTCEGLSACGYGFEKSRQKTTLTVRIAGKDWQTGLVVKDRPGEMRFLDQQRIILGPPEIEDGRIVIRCFAGTVSAVKGYQLDFALMLRKDSGSKTVSLDRYREDVSKHSDTGLTEHKFTLKDVRISQIEGVCFRYRRYESVTFRNISLVRGEDQGFEIELGQ